MAQWHEIHKKNGKEMEGWHYNRAALAQQYLDVFKLGISSSFAIIAPRRKGKTLFILRDLAPLAAKHHYLPVYASLWHDTNAPHEGIIKALQEAVASLQSQSALSRLLNTKIKKTTISNELIGKMEVEFADSPTQPSSSQLNQIDGLLDQLAALAGDKTILLLIDEVQHLATSPKFEALTHALRTMLDKRQGAVKSLFTGSSRHYMDLLFNESQSPFYHFVEPLPFPDLDDAFLLFLRNKLIDDHQLPCDLLALDLAFQSIDSSPYWMMKLVTRMITHRQSVEDAQSYILEVIEAAENYPRIAQKMKPVDRLLFLVLCRQENPFSKELMERVGKETNVKGVQSNIQRALQRLSEQHLISRIAKGEYYIEKPGLKRFIEHHYPEAIGHKKGA